MNIDFQKYADGLVPAVVQDSVTNKVLMLGFMNDEALALTRMTGKATFFSRKRKRFWTKGETSGNFLKVEDILIDCDSDTILVKAKPEGPICHRGSDTCFGEKNEPIDFLSSLEEIIKDRKTDPVETSYTSKLFEAGLNKIAQKVGEEAIELVIEAKDDNDDLFKAEAADLLFHFLVLLVEKKIPLADIVDTLKKRSG